MRLLLFLLLIFAPMLAPAQSCYVRLEDASGFNTDAYQADLEAAACALRAAFPDTFQNKFKVYDFGFYLHQETFSGGYPEAFAQKLAQLNANTAVPYYLLFGKQTDATGIYTRLWVEVKLPTTGRFSCMSELQRAVYGERVQKKIEDGYKAEGATPRFYARAELAGIAEALKIVGEIKDCCVVKDGGMIAAKVAGCDGCSDEVAASYFDLNGFETYQISAQLSPLANIVNLGILDKSKHKITVNGSTSHIADVIDSLVLYLNTKLPLAVAVTSNPSLCEISTLSIESYLNQSGSGFKAWINFASTDAGQMPLKLRVYYEGTNTPKFTSQLNEILINHIKCEFSNRIGLSGGICDNSNILNLHNYYLSTNTEYRDLNETFATAPFWLWPIIRELGIELVIELLKRQGGKVVQLPLNVVEALRAIQQGDLFEFLDEAKDILASFSVPFKIFDAIWDAGEIGWKANKVIGKIRAMYSSLGEAAISKIWNAINKNSDVLNNFDVSGGNKGLKLIGKNVSDFWDDLKIEFGVSLTPSDGRSGVYFQAGDIYFVNYPKSDTDGNPAIEIRKCKLPGTCSGNPTANNSNDIYKFRF